MGATALGVLTRTPLESGNGQFDAPPAQDATKVSAIIGFVGHQFFGASFRAPAFLGYANGRQGHLSQRTLMGLGTIDMQADGRPIALGHHYDLVALTDLDLLREKPCVVQVTTTAPLPPTPPGRAGVRGPGAPRPAPGPRCGHPALALAS